MEKKPGISDEAYKRLFEAARAYVVARDKLLTLKTIQRHVYASPAVSTPAMIEEVEKNAAKRERPRQEGVHKALLHSIETRIGKESKKGIANGTISRVGIVTAIEGLAFIVLGTTGLLGPIAIGLGIAAGIFGTGIARYYAVAENKQRQIVDSLSPEKDRLTQQANRAYDRAMEIETAYSAALAEDVVRGANIGRIETIGRIDEMVKEAEDAAEQALRSRGSLGHLIYSEFGDRKTARRMTTGDKSRSYALEVAEGIIALSQPGAPWAIEAKDTSMASSVAG